MQIEIGNGISTAVWNIVPISIDVGESVTVTNVAGGTLFYYSGTNAATLNGSLTAGNSQAFTRPVWIQSRNRTTVQLTGGKYGAN